MEPNTKQRFGRANLERPPFSTTIMALTGTSYTRYAMFFPLLFHIFPTFMIIIILV
jgi:hypothetical protein